MKICILTTLHFAKDSRIYFKEALSLVKRYPGIILVAPGVEKDKRTFPDTIRFEPIRSRRGKIGRIQSIFNGVRMVRKIKPDVFHFHEFDLLFAVPLLRVLTKAKLVYDVHEAYPEAIYISPHIPQPLRPTVSKLVDVFEKSISKFCHLIVAADDATADTFKRKSLSAVTIFNYPLLDLFQPDPTCLMHLRKLYAGRVPIIYHGGMFEERGLFHMIQAMAILKQKKPSLLLFLIGFHDKKLAERINQIILEMNLTDVVEIKPWLECSEIINYLFIAKLGLVPLQPTKKYMKNIPVKIFEYMACGVPVLGSNLPPIATYINQSGAGRVYDSTSVEALARNIIEMTENESEWKGMREKGLLAVRERWNWKNMEERLLSAYKGLEKKPCSVHRPKLCPDKENMVA